MQLHKMALTVLAVSCLSTLAIADPVDPEQSTFIGDQWCCHEGLYVDQQWNREYWLETIDASQSCCGGVAQDPELACEQAAQDNGLTYLGMCLDIRTRILVQ